ncbi:tetratricopeptide repeat protein [Chondromyces crocatus]|uniref:PEGA domain-containing protein n=1 Tax=Chondromyces crocatus TaxID=52 RepID=A0A0K1EBG0_CHOCO|nr:hypothetical protein [Chondromyces crocatus]AKT37918.1 uncharacterized protein CMC5_020610 [Chondromyces crocatus]
MVDRNWVWTGIFLLSFPVQFALVPTASAAPPPKPDARAAALFREGRVAMAREDYATACPRFEESARIEPAPGTLLNLGLCQEKVGQLAHALHSFTTAIDKLPPHDERILFARERVAAILPQVARLTVVLPRTAPPDVRVLRDGQEVPPEELGVEVPIDAGRHQIELELPGEPTLRRSILLAPGESRTVSLDEVEQKTQATVEVKPSSAWPSRATVGYVVGGVGAASLTTSLITGALVLGKKSIVDEECNESTCRSQKGIDAASAGSTLSTVSTVTFVAGLLGVGAGVYLVLTDEGSSSDGATSGAGASSATMFGPTFLPGGAALSVWRQF